MTVLGALLSVAATPLLSFIPADADQEVAAAEYRQLWCAEGRAIVSAFEEATGFRFPSTRMNVFIADVTPMTSFDGRSMWLKSSYPLYYKRATLVHELGHVLALTMPRPVDLDDHRLLYLFLHDVWSRLYGTEFADRMANIERRIRGRYDYAGAWDWALSLTPEQRRTRLEQLRSIASTPSAIPSATPAGC